MNAPRAWMLLVPIMLLTGCGGDASPSESSASASTQQVAQITEPMTGAELEVTVESTEIGLTDRAIVHATLSWKPGVRVELIVPDWTESGWTLGEQRESEIRFDGSLYTQESVYTLEPFLDGDYEIPALGMRAESKSTGKRIARLSPIAVVVDPALDESDGTELDPAIGLAEPIVHEQPTDLRALILGGVGLVVLCGTLIVWLRGRGRSETPHRIEPEAMLTLAATAPELSDADLGELHHAMITLSTEHTGLTPLSQEIERLRFSAGSIVDHQRVQNTAKRAMEVCGLKGGQR